MNPDSWRHVTRLGCFTAIDDAWSDAFADWQRAGTPKHWMPTVISTRGAVLLHATPFWAYWSDGQVTTSHGLELSRSCPKGMSAVAERLISDVRGSDSGPPGVGWSTLARIDEVLARETLIDSGITPSGYQGRLIERLDVLYVKRKEPGELYILSEGYAEGYAMKVGFQLEDL